MEGRGLTFFFGQNSFLRIRKFYIENGKKLGGSDFFSFSKEKGGIFEWSKN